MLPTTSLSQILTISLLCYQPVNTFSTIYLTLHNEDAITYCFGIGFLLSAGADVRLSRVPT